MDKILRHRWETSRKQKKTKFDLEPDWTEIQKIVSIAIQEPAEGIVGTRAGKASEALQCRKAEDTDRPSRKAGVEGLNGSRKGLNDRVNFPKPGGGIRKLGIPTVLDRFIRQIVLQVLQEDWDPSFSDASFGFRPGRSAHQAIARAQEYVRAGFTWVVDMDLWKQWDRKVFCFAGRSKTVYQNDLINRTAVVRDPYARWCGRGGAARFLPIPIRF